jgi:hypothetical protein
MVLRCLWLARKTSAYRFNECVWPYHYCTFEFVRDATEVKTTTVRKVHKKKINKNKVFYKFFLFLFLKKNTPTKMTLCMVYIHGIVT